MTRSPRVWLITGAARGLGRAFAEAALRHGDIVVGTIRTPGGLDGLREAFPDTLYPVELDVTDAARDREVVDAVVAEHGRLDVLVNNAGYGLSGAVEEASEEQVRRQFETNVFGLLWLTQAAVGHMRRQRRGHIVHLSSLGGVVGLPNTGIYAATKFAVEALGESMAAEVAAFGVRVTILEPGPFASDWNGDSMDRATPIADYDEVLAERRSQHSGAYARTQPGDPALAAAALLTVLDAGDPPLRLLLGGRASDLAPETTRAKLAEWARWEHVGRPTDFS